MRYLVFFFRRLVQLLPFLWGVLLVGLVNYRRSRRYRQVLIPPFVLAFAFLVLIDFEWLEGMSRALLMLVLHVPVPLNGPGNAFVMSCVTNFTYMAFVAALKLLYRPVSAVIFSLLGNRADVLFGLFYEYDTNDDRWYLSDRNRGMRGVARNLFIGTIILSCVLFFIDDPVYEVVGFMNTFYPCFGVALVGECYYVLSGETRIEHHDTLDSEAEIAQKHHSYYKIAAALKHYFGDKILSSFSTGRRQQSEVSNDDFCEELISSTSYAGRLAGTYFRTLIRDGVLGSEEGSSYDEFNRSYALNTVSLLEGQSVLFADPFYYDYLPYVFLPIHAALLRDKHVVFLFGSNGNEGRIRSYIEEGTSFVGGVEGLWSIDHLARDGSASPDIALLSFDELSGIDLLRNNESYFSGTSFVVVIDPSNLLATYQIPISAFASLVNRGSNATFAVFDKNSDGLVDSLSHAFRTHLVEVSATEFGQGTAVGVFWDADADDLQHRLFSGVTHYLGVAPEIGLVALKSQASKVTWAARDNAPLADQRWILGQYYRELFDFAELPQNQAELDRHFDFAWDLWSMKKESECFVMAEDEYNNLYEVYRQFATRGTDEAFVNILAPNYLLRAYMTSNDMLFRHDPKAIPSLAPDFPKSERNLMVELVLTMFVNENKAMLPEEEVLRKCRYFGLRERDTRMLLERLIHRYLTPDAEALAFGEPPESYLISKKEVRYDPVTDAEDEHLRFGILDRARYASCFRDILNVPLVTELPDGTRQVLGVRLYGLVWQSFLPGQFLVIDGKYYEVLSISAKTGVLLRRAADHFVGRRYYRQIREYGFKAPDDVDALQVSSRKISTIQVSTMRLNVWVSTRGYLIQDNYGDVEHARFAEVQNVPVRKYAYKDVLKITLPDASKEVVRTLTVVLSEMLATLFPKDHQYVSVLSLAANDFPEGITGRLASPEAELLDELSIYFVEDSPVDMGLIVSIDRNIERMLGICCEFLTWHEDALWTTRIRKASGSTVDTTDDKSDEGQTENEDKSSEKESETSSESKKKGLLKRFIEWIQRHFRKKGANDAK